MIGASRIDNMLNKPAKTMLDLKKEVLKLVREEMASLKKAPLSPEETRVTENLAKIICSPKNLEDIGVKIKKGGELT